MLEIVIDGLEVVSEANRGGHWRGRHQRAKRQKERIGIELLMRRDRLPRPPLTVTLVRIAPRRLDDDNLRRAFKAIRDEVATAILPVNAGNQHRRWADDGDGQIVWLYEQRKGQPKERAVQIRLEPRTERMN